MRFGDISILKYIIRDDQDISPAQNATTSAKR